MCAAGFVVVSGCVSADISRATSLMNAGMGILSKINITSENSTSVKADLDLAKTDYEQALRILTNIKTDNNDEKSIVRFNTDICNYNLELIDGLKKYVTLMEHTRRSLAYNEARDFSSAHNEISLAKGSLADSIISFRSAEQIADRINADSLPPESRGQFVKMQQAIRQCIAATDDFSLMVDGMDHLITAIEHLTKGDNYLKSNNLAMLKSEYSLAKTALQQAKNDIDLVKNSKIPEISVLAIQTSSKLDATINAINAIVGM
jgi:tetratricopeptide (TPR) repeat protein